MAKARKLTEAEKKRTVRFEEKAAKLVEEGYERNTLTMDVAKANILSVVVMLPFVLLIAVPYFWIHGIEKLKALEMSGILMCVGFFILETILHEGIHGLVWGLLNKDGFSAIEFGFIKEYFTPYCYCGTPLLRWQYILGSVMPTVVLGFGQGIAAILTGNPVLLFLAVTLMLGGGGDFLIIFKLITYRQKKKEMLVMDHPSEVGSVVFEKD